MVINVAILKSRVLRLMFGQSFQYEFHACGSFCSYHWLLTLTYLILLHVVGTGFILGMATTQFKRIRSSSKLVFGRFKDLKVL